MKKLEYLNKYRGNKLTLIETADLSQYKEYIPQKWIDALSADDFSVQKKNAIQVWENSVSSELRNTISYLKDYLISLDVAFDGKEYTLIYGIAHEKGVGFYEGRFTQNLDMNESLSNQWNNVPSSIKRFYEEVHNGFYYFASRSMGLDPQEDVTCLGVEDWGILETLQEKPPICLDTSFGFFSSGAGGYVVIDTNANALDNATLWFSNREPKYNKNFWDFVDEWIVIGFQN